MRNTIISQRETACRTICRRLLLLALLLTGVFQMRAQNNNFNDGNDNGWVRSDPVQEILQLIYQTPQPAFASWSFPNGGYRIQSSPSPDMANLGPSRAGSYRTNDVYTYTNFYLSVDIRPWGDTTNQAIGVLARIQPGYSGYGQTFAYTLTYEPYVRDFQITAFNNAILQLTVQKVDLSPTNSHRMVFIGNADYLEGRIYVLPDVSNPVATISTTDSTFAGGWCGLLVFSNPNEATDATYDNYLAMPEPPLSLTISTAGTEVSVSWPAGLLTYTLQTSSVLQGTAWTPITTGITQSNGVFTYKTTASGPAFYRLVTNYQ